MNARYGRHAGIVKETRYVYKLLMVKFLVNRNREEGKRDGKITLRYALNKQVWRRDEVDGIGQKYCVMATCIRITDFRGLLSQV
jgi:hypothetical protein